MNRVFAILIAVFFPTFLFSQINWFDQELISEDVTVKEEFPDQNFNNEAETDGCGRTWKRLYVRDTVNATQEIFLKANISGLAPYITRTLRLRGTQNNESTHAYRIEVYGSKDVSWSESTLTWNNSRDILLTEEPVAWYNLNLHSWNGKYVNFNDNGLYDYISNALAEDIEDITLVFKSKEINSENTAFFYSREQPMAFWCNGGEDMWDELPKPKVRTSASSFQQEADATVRESVPDGNYGKDNSLDVLLSSFGENRKSYIRFNLENISGFVSGATLHFQGKQASGSQDPYYISVYESGANWYEDSITWNNAPEHAQSPLATENVNTNQKLWWEFTGDRLTEVINSALLLNEDSLSLVFASSSPAFAEVWFQSHELDDACGIELQFIPAVVNAPVISPSSGNDFEDSVQITMEAEGADRIYYTFDGSEPTARDSLYSGPFWIKRNGTLNARSFAGGYPSENYTSETYNFSKIYVAPVVIDPAGGSYTDSVLVNMEGEAGAALFYTTDGTMPDNESTEYLEPFWIYNNTEVKATAFKNGFYSEDITTVSFTINQSVGFNNINSNTYVDIYPNPVSSEVHIKVKEKSNNLKIVITNITGQQVYSKKLKDSDGDNISLQNYADGVYTIAVWINEKWYGSKTIIKKH